jgi:hypothetical protein
VHCARVCVCERCTQRQRRRRLPKHNALRRRGSCFYKKGAHQKKLQHSGLACLNRESFFVQARRASRRFCRGFENADTAHALLSLSPLSACRRCLVAERHGVLRDDRACVKWGGMRRGGCVFSVGVLLAEASRAKTAHLRPLSLSSCKCYIKAPEYNQTAHSYERILQNWIDGGQHVRCVLRVLC